MGGNYTEFTTRLIREKAEDKYDGDFLAAVTWWEAKLVSAKQVKKWTRDEVESMLEDYKQKLAGLG
jgi:hypothetical protein